MRYPPDIPPDNAGGALIRYARERMMLTQTELAARLGVSQQIVSRWERGVVEPGFDNVLRAVGAAGWDLLAALMPQEKLPPKSEWPRGRVTPPSTIRRARLEMLGVDFDSVDETGIHLRRYHNAERARRRRGRGDDRRGERS